MSMEDYLKAFWGAPQEKQNNSMENDGGNTGEPLLETHGNSFALEQGDVEILRWPQEMSLHFEIIPQRLQEVIPEYGLQFSSKGVVDRPLVLGQAQDPVVQRCCAALLLRWQGTGYQQASLTMPEDFEDALQALLRSYVHTKAFTLPPGAHFQCEEHHHVAEGRWVYGCPLWPDLRDNERPLIPFGGYMPLDLDLEKMMPMYALVRGGESTHLELKAQTYWQRFGVYPGQKGYIDDRFYSLVGLDVEHLQNSLAQDIKGGVVRFENEDVHYQSYSYEVIDPIKHSILIHFKKG